MKVRDPYHLLSLWKRRNKVVFLAAVLLCCISLLIIKTLLGASWTLLFAMCVVGFIGLHWFYSKSQPGIEDVLHLAHQQNDKLEYSGQLLLNDALLNGLAQIQVKKVKEFFSVFNYRISLDYKLVRRYILFSLLLSSLFLFMLILSLYFQEDNKFNSNLKTQENGFLVLHGNDSTYISKTSLSIEPPAYTRLPARKTTGSVEIHEGSNLTWDIDVIGEIDKFYFIFSDGDSIFLQEPYKLKRQFIYSDYYQYGFQSGTEEYTSDYYSIKVLGDKKPEVFIEGIEEYTRLPWNAEHTITFGITILDDYALSEAYISATIAKGSGEAVKFRERKFEIENFYPGRKRFSGKHSFSTRNLDMGPGDELYFFVRTKDNCPFEEQWTKSVTYFLTIQDTTNYTFTASSGMQVDLMPEFFRSQRQIIIDSEQLLKDKKHITPDSFKFASNALGYDQKMLRLKYGQFLGEESESGIAIPGEQPDDHDHDDNANDGQDEKGHTSNALETARNLIDEFMHDHDHEDEEHQLLSTKGTERRQDPSKPTWVEELSHNHDDAEIATFHDVSVKSKLKAALSEMWDAELHLRLYHPESSLPYQYKSLSLLQEVKNHARIYVHRIGFDPPAIKETEVRLTGEHNEITSPLTLLETTSNDAYLEIRKAIASLGSVASDDQIQVFRAVEALAKISLDQPELLPVLSFIQQELREHDLHNPALRAIIRKKLISIIPQPLMGVEQNLHFTHEFTRSIAKKLVVN